MASFFLNEPTRSGMLIMGSFQLRVHDDGHAVLKTSFLVRGRRVLFGLPLSSQPRLSLPAVLMQCFWLSLAVI